MSVKELSAGVWKGRRDEDEDKPIPHGRFGFVVMTGVQRSTVRRTFAPGEHALLDNKGTIKDVLCKRNILQALRSRGSLNAMSRRPVHRTLPPLAELQPRFRCFGSTQNASRSLVEILRLTIDAVREDRARHFYSQREVSRFFKVPLKTAHLAFRQLVNEGLLSSMRGSSTMVTGRKLQPRNLPRGVVGLPIWTRGFALLPHWQTFFIHLEEELRKEGFVADLVFFQGHEASDPNLAERLLAHHLDSIIWLYPLSRALPLLERLADGGVQTIALVEPRWLSSPSVHQYEVAWDGALAQALATWHDDGIHEAILVGIPTQLTQVASPLQKALASAGMSHRFWHRENLDELPRVERAGVIFLEELSSFVLSRRNPQAMIRLLNRSRVLMRNSVPLAEPPRGLCVDLVRVEWEKLARRIARDLASHPHHRISGTLSVKAQWLPRAQACEFAELF